MTKINNNNRLLNFELALNYVEECYLEMKPSASSNRDSKFLIGLLSCFTLATNNETNRSIYDISETAEMIMGQTKKNICSFKTPTFKQRIDIIKSECLKDKNTSIVVKYTSESNRVTADKDDTSTSLEIKSDNPFYEAFSNIIDTASEENNKCLPVSLEKHHCITRA